MTYKVQFNSQIGWHIVNTKTGDVEKGDDISVLKRRCAERNQPAPAAVRIPTAAERLAERMEHLKLAWGMIGGHPQEVAGQTWRLFDNNQERRWLCTVRANRRYDQDEQGNPLEIPTGTYYYEFYNGFGLEKLSPSVIFKSDFTSLESAKEQAARVACIWMEAGAP